MSKLTLSFRGKTLKVYPILQGSMSIGSAPSCQIVIDSLAVAPQHARIETHGKDSILFGIDENEGTFVHQERISEHKLKSGDLIRIGKHNLLYTYEEVSQLSADDSTTSIDISGMNESSAEPFSAVNSSGQKHGWIQVLNGQNLGKTFSLNRSMTNLGKPGVATAVITRRQDGYFISHLEGKVTPTVADTNIGKHSIKLKDGDIIQIGNIRLQFYLE